MLLYKDERWKNAVESRKNDEFSGYIEISGVYGLMTFEDAEKAVNYGAAHGALAMTTPGDTTMASLKEVEGIVGGAGARVQR